MTTPRSARALAILFGSTLVLAACGPAASGTGGPGETTAAVVTQAPASQAPAATDGPGLSFDLSSFHGDVDLESLLPDEIGGEPVTTLSMTGEEFLDPNTPNEFGAALTALGKQPSDMSVAFGGVEGVNLFAFRVQGVPGSATLDALIDAFEEGAATVTEVSFGGKSVKKIVPTDPDDETGYAYTTQDAVISVSGPAITDAQLNEVFSSLP